jgi:transposase-like protein
MSETKVCKRYSEGFKRQIVAEYEAGASTTALCRKYGIGSESTVSKWVKKYAAAGLRHDLVHIQTPAEAEQLRQLEQERDLLRRALADLTVQKLLLEGQLQVYQEAYGDDVLKKNARASLNTPTPLGREA